MGFGEPKMPTLEEMAKQQPEESVEEATNSSEQENVDDPLTAIKQKFDVAVEIQNISEENRAELREEFRRRIEGMPEKVAKAAMGQLLLKAMKMAKSQKNSEQESACPKCGAPTGPGSNFCGQCGNKLK